MRQVPGAIAPQATPRNTRPSRGLFGEKYSAPKANWADKLGLVGAMLTDLDQGGGTANTAAAKAQWDAYVQDAQAKAQAEMEATREAALRKILGQTVTDPRQAALLQAGAPGATEALTEQAFAPKDPFVINSQVIDREDPTRVIADYRTPEAPADQWEDVQLPPGMPPGYYQRNTNTGAVKRVAAPPNAGVTVNTGDVTAGNRPITDKPPKDFQRIWDPETGSYRDEPIPGSDTARERETYAVKSAAAQRADDEQFDTMTRNIDRAMEQASYWSAGLMSQATSQIGMTPARNLRATLDTIVANIGFDKLNEMRQTSPTGGALGQVTERELAFLQSVRGSLDQAQSPDQLRRTLQDVKDSLGRLYEARRIAAQLNMTNSGERTPSGNLNEDPNMNELLQYMTPEERALFEGQQ
jgi:hypothetical protein